MPDLILELHMRRLSSAMLTGPHALFEQKHPRSILRRCSVSQVHRPSISSKSFRIFPLKCWLTRESSPPYHNIFEKIADQPRQWMRRASEQLLQHASSDVAQIHRLIRALREEIERGYVPRIIPVVVTRPRILALYDEDINDALKFNGLLEKEPDLESVQAAKGCPMPGHSTAVAWGSSGRYARSKDQETILSVLYTRKALQVQRGTLSSNNLCDWEASEREDNSILSWELGSEALERLESQEYWARVRALLLELPARPSLGEDPIARVVLHGESANLTDFVEVVKNTVTQLPQDKDPTVICDDPMFTAARGAMTLAIQQRTECLSEPS